MAYTSLEELADKFGNQMLIQLTDRAEVATGVIDTDVVDRALADTDALIDGYAGVKYALPMATTPPLIEALALRITIYNLHVYEPNPKIEADYKAAMRSLEGIAAGSVRLPVAGKNAATTGGSGAKMTDRKRPMTSDNLRGY